MKNKIIPIKEIAALLLLFTMACTRTAVAQITLYNRTVLNGQTYTQITGGTVINTNAQLTAGSMSTNQDDGAVLVNLPFTFTYNGNAFTQVTFCTNGWIGMGNQTSITAAQGRAPGNLFTGTVPNNTIAAWFGDMGANFPGSGSMVHGTAGTGVYAFEWRNAVGSGFNITATNLINFMIKIYGPASASPGRIEMLYGTQTGTLTTGRVIGIEDAQGGANRFINALNGSFTATTTATAWPGNGNGYRFDPPVPCSGMPSSGVINAPASVCPGNFTISLSGHTFGPGTIYQWQSKPSTSGTFTNIGTNSSSLTTAIAVPTDFRCIVTCTNSGQAATTATVSIGVNSFYACYCKGSLGGAAAGPSIDSVAILNTTLNNGTPGVAAGSYTQYPASGNYTANLQAGGLYSLHVKYGASAIGSAWLDANHNGNFEANEWVQVNTSGTTALIMVQVPPTAQPGLTGLRIRSASTGSTNGPTNPCTSFGSGETEDYIVNIIPAPVNDLKLVSILNPPSGKPGICPFSDIPVTAVIYNNGTNAQNGFNITALRTGSSSASNSITYTKVLAPFKFDTVAITTYNFTLTGSFDLRAYISGAVDVDASNDTSANHPFKILFTANLPLIRSDSVCFGETALLTVKSDTVRHNWYRTATGGSPIYTGDTVVIPNLQKDSVLYVRSAGTKSKGSLTTLNATNNNCTAGTMFDIVANTPLSIDSFEALFTTTGSQSITIYYKTGTYIGSETNASAWTSLGTYTVNPTSTANYTMVNLANSVLLNAGTTYGFFLNYNSAYTNGTNNFPNADMTLIAGAGFCTAFTSPIAGRIFNGRVHYSKGADICESPSQPVTAYAGPVPAANLGPDLTACENVELILDAGHAGGGYLWNTAEMTQTIKVKNGSGTYWVLVDKYCTSSDTIVITQEPLPSVTGISYQKAGNRYSFTAADIKNAKSFEWIFGDGTTDNSNINPTHIYPDDKPYKVSLVLYNDCGADTTDLFIPVGIRNNEAGDNEVLIYPNPASDKLRIEINGLKAIKNVMIVNSIGVTVYKGQDIESGKKDIDVSQLPAGNYMISIMNDDKTITRPIVIRR